MFIFLKCCNLYNKKKKNCTTMNLPFIAVFISTAVLTSIFYLCCKDPRSCNKRKLKQKRIKQLNNQKEDNKEEEEEKRAETFVRVGAETPDDKTDDPSPPLAVVRSPLQLKTTSAKTMKTRKR